MVKEKIIKPKNNSFWDTNQVFDYIIELLLLVVIFLIPTFFDRRLGIVFSGAKISMLRSLGAIILGVWAAKIIINKEHHFVRTVLDWPVAAFLLCTTVATLSSVHVYTSFVGFYGRYEGLTTWYLFGLLFFITTNYIHSFAQLKRIVLITISSSTLMSIYSIIQRHSLDPYMWGGVITWQRVIGTIGQPNFMAAYNIMVFFLILALLLMQREEATKPFNWVEQVMPISYFLFVPIIFLAMIYNLEANNIFLWYTGFSLATAAALLFAFNYLKIERRIFNSLLIIVLLLNFISLLYTQSRGGFMGFATGAVLFSLIAGRKWLLANWKKFTVLGVLVLVISTMTMLNPEYSPLQRFAAEVKTEKVATAQGVDQKLELSGAAGSRGETWKSAFGVIADRPFFGIGPEVLKMVFPRYETDLFRFREAFHVKQDRCHNETFDVSVTKGLIAFAIYLWLLGAVFWAGWKKIGQVSENERLLIAGLLGAILAYLIQNQFSFGVVAITTLFWVMWGMVMVVGKEYIPTKIKAINWLDVPWFNLAIVFMIVLIISYTSFFSFRGDIWFKTGKTQIEMRQFPPAIDSLERSLRIFPYEGITVSHLAIAYLNMSNIAPTEREKYLQQAVATLNYGIIIDPFNADNFYMLAKIYLMRYDLGNKKALLTADQFANKAIKIDPYYAEVYQTLGLINERRGELTKAAQNYERSFMINPNLVEPMNDLDRVMKGQGIQAVYDKLLQKYPDNPTVLERVARLYLAAGNIQGVKKMSANLVAEQPALPIGYILQAIVAEKSGDLSAAYNNLQLVLMKDPKNVMAHAELGRVYLLQNDRGRAKSEYEQILMIDPNNQEAREMYNRLK
jgi:tetratricopeptide (TPR) repeat protein/O-antigen ligase